jgi:hypothetical protein
MAPGSSPASHAGNINLGHHITRGDPLKGEPSNPSSASHEPLSAHRLARKRLIGDGLVQPVYWRDNTELDAVMRGQPLRQRFEVLKADLDGFQFQE